MSCHLTEHARQRMQHRGVRDAELISFLNLSIQEKGCGGGCDALMLARKDAESLKSEGIPPQMVDRLSRLRVILSEDGVIVSVMPRWRLRRTRPMSRRTVRGNRHHG